MKIEIDKNEELEITHKGSVRKLVIGVDEVDDICFRALPSNKDKLNMQFCDRCEIDVDVNTHVCFNNPIKTQIREIVKSHDKEGGIRKEEIFRLISICACNELVSYSDVEQNVNDLLINGECYYCKPNILRWLVE